jgi:hypothetical protein
MQVKNLRLLLLSFCLGALNQINAQEIIKEHKTVLIETPRSGTVNVSDINVDYFPKIQLIEMPKPGMATEEDDAELAAAKLRVRPEQNSGQSQYKQSATLKSPFRLRCFEGNSYNGGVPDDNDIAVSNTGMVLSVMNSSLNAYDSTGKLIKSVSLDAFSQSLGLSQGKYDPRVLYDPEADRFIAVCLNGFDDKTSQVIIGFSQTNDPAGTWNLYKISGNPLGDTTWSDYPIIALTKNEMFLTLNALQDNKTWQLGFKQDLIWQIDKSSGYNGQNLLTKVHSGIKYNGADVRYICPVQGGSGLTGPECYFISDKSFSNKCDSIFLLKISGTIADSTSKLSISLMHSKAGTYGVAPNAHQPSTVKVIRTLQTNDARILDAFIENNTIQFVGNSVTAAGKAGAMHGIITNVTGTPSVSIHILGDTLEYGYPSIAYAGLNKGDDDALIVVDHSADTTFPGNSAIFYRAGSYSNGKRLFNGTSFATLTSKDERWGDYSGAQRRYNAPGKAWVAAFYGRIVGSGFNAGPGNATRISEIQSPLLPDPAGIENEHGIISGINVFPVPANSYRPLNIDFTAEQEQYYSFVIYDMQGREIARLLNEKVLPGKNRFIFSTGTLNKGAYLLKISSGVSSESRKFMVE